MCVNEHSLCGLYITGDIKLSISHDQEVMTLLPLMEEYPKDFYQGTNHKFDKSSPSTTRDKEICQGDITMR